MECETIRDYSWLYTLTLFDLSLILKVIKRYSSVMIGKVFWIFIFAFVNFLMQERQDMGCSSCSQKSLKHFKISIALSVQ